MYNQFLQLNMSFRISKKSFAMLFNCKKTTNDIFSLQKLVANNKKNSNVKKLNAIKVFYMHQQIY
jgi:hypothetical protein